MGTSPYARWRYLDSGGFIGRGRDMKVMLANPVDSVIKGGDQAFYQRYFRSHPERVGLDHSCVLLCATQGVGQSWGVELIDKRIHNHDTGTSPSVMHFVENAHFAKWVDGTPSTDINDVFQTVYPEASENLFKVIEVSMRVGGSH